MHLYDPVLQHSASLFIYLCIYLFRNSGLSLLKLLRLTKTVSLVLTVAQFSHLLVDTGYFLLVQITLLEAVSSMYICAEVILIYLL